MAAKTAGTGHQWVVAATVHLPDVLVKQAFRRGTYKIAEETKVHVQGLYCERCMKDYERVGAQPCEAVESTDHLRGGPIGERKRRVG